MSILIIFASDLACICEKLNCLITYLKASGLLRVPGKTAKKSAQALNTQNLFTGSNCAENFYVLGTMMAMIHIVCFYLLVICIKRLRSLLQSLFKHPIHYCPHKKPAFIAILCTLFPKRNATLISLFLW